MCVLTLAFPNSRPVPVHDTVAVRWQTLPTCHRHQACNKETLDDWPLKYTFKWHNKHTTVSINRVSLITSDHLDSNRYKRQIRHRRHMLTDADTIKSASDCRCVSNSDWLLGKVFTSLTSAQRRCSHLYILCNIWLSLALICYNVCEIDLDEHQRKEYTGPQNVM